jgi:transcriptional regulator with XRE-family HTH domain
MKLHDELLERCERHRKRLKLSRKLLLELAGVEQSTYYRWLNKQTSPVVAQVQRILDVHV